ncbi:MAG: 4Fe-4S dicluster domain-containing protein [Anaerolineae bacterium]|nr:4Fe-4S dicluster domain-containing protein [Anaerolineae bacterium]
MPIRIDFWGIPWEWAHLLIYVTVIGAGVVMLVRFYLQARLWWKAGQVKLCWDRPLLRLWRVIQYAGIQTRVLEQKYPGVMHIAIAGSFFIFFLGTAFAVLNTRIYEPIFKDVFLKGGIYLFYEVVLDLFVPVFLLGFALAGYRRWVVKPKRLTLEPKFTWMLLLLLAIVVTGTLVEAYRLALQKPEWAPWSPVGYLISLLLPSGSAAEAGLYQVYYFLYGFHPLLVVVAFILLPSTPLLHIFTTPINIFFSDPARPVGQLAAIPADKEGIPIYSRTLCNLTWSQLLNGDACTECGRCQEACPAYAAGQPLNPKQVILGVRNVLHRDGPALDCSQPDKVHELVGETGLTEEVLWSCTSCGACVAECPVLIEHIGTIVDLRRYLVSEGRLDAMAQDALNNLGRYGNSFGQSERARAKWAQAFEPKIKDARKEPVEYLWFVGDYASYNPALTDITAKTAEVFQQAGVDFGILYEGERNAGNDVRRVGEEGLFEMLVEKNSMAFAKSEFKAIVTTDPHSYNTLKNEYPADAVGGRPVLHYAELLDQLIASGKLRLTKKLGYKVTYHDPCYLGRYNNVYDAPRRVIQATGCEIVEMPRCRKHALCCGAGGGRIWMEEGEMKERPSESRIKEAVALEGVQVFVVACPKDTTMYRDAVKTTGHEDRLVVKDLIELVYEAL